jgi:uroporphyrinogen-III synthase
LKSGIAKTRIAAVGPIAAQSLVNRGTKVDICPDQGFVMKKLVQLLARSSSEMRPGNNTTQSHSG